MKNPKSTKEVRKRLDKLQRQIERRIREEGRGIVEDMWRGEFLFFDPMWK